MSNMKLEGRLLIITLMLFIITAVCVNCNRKVCNKRYYKAAIEIIYESGQKEIVIFNVTLDQYYDDCKTPDFYMGNPDLGRATYLGCNNCHNASTGSRTFAYNINRFEVIEIKER